MASKFKVRYEDADDKGFLAAGRDESLGISLEFLKEKGTQKSINRRILAAATRHQIRAAGQERLHYGTFLDWRGRMYFNGAGLAPQGKDAGRGSLEAADGVALGAEGLHHLKVGVATTWGTFADGRGGLDKAGLKVRAQEVDKLVAEGRLRNIVDGARQGSSFEFLLAEEPVQFLALAGDLLAALDSGNPEAHVSHVMIGYDATCSGLQILAAVTGCEATAKLVNVVPNEDGTRADIYMAVAEKLAALCAAMAGADDGTLQIALDAAMAAIRDEKEDRAAGVEADDETMASRREARTSGEFWALYWNDRKITRSVTKGPVMVYCYGGMKRTFAASIREETGAPWGACMWLATVMYDDILSDLLPRAHHFMGALQEMARTLAKHGKPVEFVAADGLPFRQAVMEVEKGQVKCQLADGRTIRPVLQRRTKKLSGAKQASGVAPNIVHHWDGLFLRNVVRNLAAAGITTFFTVHDCFYLRAGDWARGWRIIRETFVATFAGDVAATIWEQIEDIANGIKADPEADAWENEGGRPVEQMAKTIRLQACPKRGRLDLSKALESEFLFS